MTTKKLQGSSKDPQPSRTITDVISGLQVRARAEEIEAVQPFAAELLETYGYPREHIRTHPQWRVRGRPSDKTGRYPVDIMVFQGDEQELDSEYIIVECKPKRRRDGRTQLEDYLKFSAARLGVWYNGKDRFFLLKTETKRGLIFEELPNIPHYQQRVEDLGQFLRKDLKPSNNLKAVFSVVRNHWAANAVGMTRDEALSQQLINLVFCKIYDEKFTKSDHTVTFRIGFGENKQEVKKRIEGIFKEVKKRYHDVFENNDIIQLDEDSLAYFVGEVQHYCLTESPSDAVADAFEAFISPALKGPQGQFFTPRNVVNLAITLTDPKPLERIIDPACGTGGFLMGVLRYLWNKIDKRGEELSWPEEEITREKDQAAMQYIKGIDKDQFLSKVAKAYMAITGDGRGGIFCENSLENTTRWGPITKNNVQKESFDLIVTNPPFGKKLLIDEVQILRQYQLAYQWKLLKPKDTKNQEETDQQGETGNTEDQPEQNQVYVKQESLRDSQSPQILFVERCIELLKPGGRMGIILPESMFSNPSHRYIVQYLESVAKIRAVISMPEELFQPYTHAKTLVALIEKNREQETTVRQDQDDHEIFMARALWCGHDSRGLDIGKDDTPNIIERFFQYSKKEELEYDHLGFAIKSSEIIDHIYLPKYYNPEIQERLDRLRETHNLIRLGDLIKQEALQVQTGDEVGKLSYRTGNIPFIRTSDMANWEIKADPKQGLSEEIYESYKDRQDIKENDILMVRDGTYLVGTCAMITSLDIKMVYQSHIYKIRSLDHDKINPYMLLTILSSPIVQNQVYAKRFTQDIIDTLGGRLHELVIPVPKDEAARSTIISEAKNIMKSKVMTRRRVWKTINSVTPNEEVDPDSEYSFFLRNIT